jgi:hypothetical protein
MDLLLGYKKFENKQVEFLFVPRPGLMGMTREPGQADTGGISRAKSPLADLAGRTQRGRTGAHPSPLPRGATGVTHRIRFAEFNFRHKPVCHNNLVMLKIIYEVNFVNDNCNNYLTLYPYKSK